VSELAAVAASGPAGAGSTTAQAGGLTRRRYIDWARGVAVLLMIEAHAIDAWTRLPTGRWRVSGTRGSSVVLRRPSSSGCRRGSGPVGLLLARRTSSRTAAVDAICRRGLEIFILAFLFRLQASSSLPAVIR